MDDEIYGKMDEVEDLVNELKEMSEAKLAEEYSSVDIILLRDACIDYIENLDGIRERMED